MCSCKGKREELLHGNVMIDDATEHCHMPDIMA